MCHVRERHLQIIPTPGILYANMLFGQSLVKAMKARVELLFIGWGVAHTHAHVVLLCAKTDIM